VRGKGALIDGIDDKIEIVSALAKKLASVSEDRVSISSPPKVDAAGVHNPADVWSTRCEIGHFMLATQKDLRQAEHVELGSAGLCLGRMLVIQDEGSHQARSPTRYGLYTNNLLVATAGGQTAVRSGAPGNLLKVLRRARPPPGMKGELCVGRGSRLTVKLMWSNAQRGGLALSAPKLSRPTGRDGGSPSEPRR
jgi:hypothetical protein